MYKSNKRRCIGVVSVGCAILGMRAGPTGALAGSLTGALKTAADSCIKGENTPVMNQDNNSSNHHQSDSGYGDSFSSNNYSHSSNDYVSVCVSGTGNFDHCP